MTKNTFIAAALALVAAGASAADDTMYLVKGDRVVGRYATDAVDYITFNLPDDVQAANIWTEIGKVGKNTVTYTINTIDGNVAYAHNIISYYNANYKALDMFGDSFENLSEEDQTYCLKYALAYDAYFGVGTQTYTQTDFMSVGNSRFEVIPGTKYYLCVLEADPITQEPRETFIFSEFETTKPDPVDLSLDVTLKRYNSEGIALNFTGSDDILYVRTCWGMKDQMEPYEQAYGLDYLMGMFGQSWSMDFLAGFGAEIPDIENATWPAYDPGEYIMYVRAYDAAGNMEQKSFVFLYETGEASDGPTITIYTKEKGTGSVKINFEISPSNVEEAYVRMLPENDVDDRLNMGYTYPEIATGGDATDITSVINSTGEYTYTNNSVAEQWQAILIYAKDKDGGQTTLRANFFPDPESEWSIYSPFHAAQKAPSRKPAIRYIRHAGDPSIHRAGK